MKENAAVVELVPKSQNPDDRPTSTYEEDSNPYGNSLALQKMRVNEEREVVELVRTPLKATPSDFVSGAMKIPANGKLDSFSFKRREYLKAIYDSPAKRRILVAGRQVEKTLDVRSAVLLADGRLIPAGDVQVGDELATMAADGVSITTGRVAWKSGFYNKPCIKVMTRQGHVLTLALTHPMRLWGRWVEGAGLKVGDRIAAVRRAGKFTSKIKAPPERVRLTAYLLGDGYIAEKCLGFTSLPGAKLNEFLNDVRITGGTYGISKTTGCRAVQVRLHAGGVVRDWMTQDGLVGRKSNAKFVPAWVFELSRKQTALFLNRLWSTDGHVKKNGPSKYSIEYCSISETLVHQVQALLWKFGIPSKIRENWPSIYKRRGEKRLAYILRVETQGGIRRFLTEIGAFTKSEKVPLPSSDSNNNRDTLPKEVNRLIKQILASRGADDWKENRKSSLFAKGLRRTLKYPLTSGKLRDYVEFFRSDKRFGQEIVDQLQALLVTDIYWDEIVEITPVGRRECVDFEVEGTHNFIAEGLITHNSTCLGNTCLSYALINPFFRVLYVSPSNQQTKVFSRDRIAEPIEVSPFLSRCTNSRLLKNVLEKKFVNRSQITLRFAFLNADRTRGIPADLVVIDEFQDILLENVPVIEECASHSEFKFFIYAGTPKSLDNSIEYYWTRFSTQNEWAVPCKRHGTPKDASTWHWNLLDEENIGKNSLICNRCGKRIRADDPDASWAAMNPRPNTEKPFEGFRIPQLMVPWIDWSDIRNKQRVYSRAKFYNEVLGRSYDAGTRPLTRRDVQRNCWDELSMKFYRDVMQYSSSYPIFMGLDWGTGELTYTVVTLGGYLPFAPDRYTVFYWHRFEGSESEPRKQLEIIRKLIVDFNVQRVGADYGGGHWPNDELTRDFGADKVKKYQWVGNVKKKIKFEAQMGVPRHLCHRTEIMSDIFNAIKRGNVFWFPRWEEFEDPYAADLLNIYSEFNDRLRMNVYKAAPSHPDDSFHSLVFGFLASFYSRPRPDVILPTKEVQRQHELTGTAWEEEAEDLEDLDVI